MNLRFNVVAFVALFVLAHRAAAQATPTDTSPLGVWRGTSTCLVRPSACHDESTVYRITSTKASDSVSLDAFKIVNAREDDMGVLSCYHPARSTSFTCTIPHGVWRFTVRGDSLVGELRLPDNTKFRDVRAARSR